MKTSHKPKSTIDHTQSKVHWELVTGACKRGNNPSFRMTNTNIKGLLGKGPREKKTYTLFLHSNL